MTQHMISTTDNPFNPFDDFEHWKSFDDTHGHNSLAILARLAKCSDGLTPKENSREIATTIEDIAKNIVSSNGEQLVHYVMVTKDK